MLKWNTFSTFLDVYYLNNFRGETKNKAHQHSIKSMFCKAAHVNEAPNNVQEVVTDANGSRSSSNKQKRKWRNQWTLLYPWAYVTKSLLGDDSTFFSILIDESIDRTLEKHLIIYVLYLSEGGKGSHIVNLCDFFWWKMWKLKASTILSMNSFWRAI